MCRIFVVVGSFRQDIHRIMEKTDYEGVFFTDTHRPWLKNLEKLIRSHSQTIAEKSVKIFLDGRKKMHIYITPLFVCYLISIPLIFVQARRLQFRQRFILAVLSTGKRSLFPDSAFRFQFIEIHTIFAHTSIFINKNRLIQCFLKSTNPRTKIYKILIHCRIFLLFFLIHN